MLLSFDYRQSKKIYNSLNAKPKSVNMYRFYKNLTLKKKKNVVCFGLAVTKGDYKRYPFCIVECMWQFSYMTHRYFSLKNGWRKWPFLYLFRGLGESVSTTNMVHLSDADSMTQIIQTCEEKNAELIISSGGE